LSCNRCAAIHIAEWKNGERVLQAVDTRSKKKDISRNQPLLYHLLASEEKPKNLYQSGFDRQQEFPFLKKFKNTIQLQMNILLKNFHHRSNN